MYVGAVTSPTVLPPGSCATLLGIGPTGLCHSDIQIPHKLSGAENDCHLFFEKEKQHSESCTHIEDSEAEAEAAASAVAVAAISNDEMVTNGIGTCSVSVPLSNNFGGGDISVITAGSGSFDAITMISCISSFVCMFVFMTLTLTVLQAQLVISN